MRPALVVHVGDIHGGVKCRDSLLDLLRGYLNAVQAPILYTPGDNGWTDCGSKKKGGYDPLERLSRLRALFFQGSETLGAQPLRRETQCADGYPENAGLAIGGVGFVTLHVVGSNNNFSPDDIDVENEFMARNAASLRWLEESFDKFDNLDAIVVALHADMFRNLAGVKAVKKAWATHSPYRKIGERLFELSDGFGKSVLLIYGNSHEHRAFQPFAQ